MKFFTKNLMLFAALWGGYSMNAQTLVLEENFADAASTWATTMNSTTAYSGEIISQEKSWICTNLFYSTAQTGLNMKTSSSEAILEFPVINAKVESVVLAVKFGSKPSGTPTQLVLQKKNTTDGTWSDVGQTAISSNAYVDFTITISEPTDVTYLRLHYVTPTYGLFLKNLKVYAKDEVMKAPVVGETSAITSEGAMINWAADAFAEGYEVEVTKLNVLTNQELITNGGFEDADISMWNTDYLSTENAFAGTRAFKVDASTMTTGAKTFRYQPNLAILPYSTVTLSSKYFVSSLSETHGEARSWSEFLTGDGAVISSTNAHISGDPAYQTVSTQWGEMNGAFTTPYNATALQIDFRSQFGVVAFFDNISVVTDVRVAGGTPIANSPFTGIHQVSHQLNGLESDTYYSAYVYSVQGSNKLKSSEIVFKTSIASGIASGKSTAVEVYNNAQGVRVINLQAGDQVSFFNLSGQMIKTVQATGSLIEETLSKGAYIVKVGEFVFKVVI